MRNVQQILDQKGHRIVSAAPTDSVRDVISLMAENNVAAVLIMKGNELVGISTERDYARKVILLGRNSADTPVSDIMTSPVLCVSPGDTAQRCMSLMTEKKCRHLPVRDNGQVLGMVSIGDLVKAVIEDQQQEIQALQQYISS
ncbi:MAG TPA: CBS domain-containing protein [Arenimonas sp.]|nr:CBS domain-containing protein [Arenimonas sp.]HOZ06291.1 CBS domain-containing protein [Arenimonas sp.]HPO24346.1 CBS domain-containing protein [Arenimonas sp.]HPW33165.1 CBS domain-containing protein [Arenimonas sp.]